MKEFLDLSFKRITLGNLMSMTTIIVTVVLAYSNIKAELAVMQNDISWIKKEMVSRSNIHAANNNAK